MQEKEELLTLHDEEQKREVNLPFKLVVGVKISQLFPRLSDRILENMFK